MDYLLTPTESQAQILEAALIKDKQPPYNISLKDDKSFPWIRISGEVFPIISVCRRKEQQTEEGCFYFGPYTNPRLLRQAIKLIRKIFGFRSCKNLPKEPCLYYRLNLCPAPCAGKISKEDYQDIINNIKMFLSSRDEELLDKLSKKMSEAAKNELFEEAAKIRDQITAFSVISQGGKGTVGIDELWDLKKSLNLEVVPQRIEAFDISNISGKEACGSMVSFYNGSADKANYRRFRIKTVNSVDDYAMLKEVVYRRYSRLVKDKLVFPDLVLIDGGRGHLMAAQQVLNGLGVKIPLVSIAKQRENIYTIGLDASIHFKEGRQALNLIRRIRDEAHRFAVSYHHVLRRKKVLGR